MLWLSNQSVRFARRGLRVFLFQGFHEVWKGGGNVLDAPPLNACSAGFLAG
jgi:hypothetical protein